MNIKYLEMTVNQLRRIEAIDDDTPIVLAVVDSIDGVPVENCSDAQRVAALPAALDFLSTVQGALSQVNTPSDGEPQEPLD